MKTEEPQIMSKEQLIKLLIQHRPWESEPNNVRFKALGYDCEIKRHPELLHLCGYITIPSDHPLFEVEEGEMDHFIGMHGGVTYDKKRRSTRTLGFDCAHAEDFSPGTFMALAYIRMRDGGEMAEVTDRLFHLNPPENYKTVKWVADQLTSVAMTLKTHEIRYEATSEKEANKC